MHSGFSKRLGEMPRAERMGIARGRSCAMGDGSSRSSCEVPVVSVSVLAIGAVHVIVPSASQPSIICRATPKEDRLSLSAGMVPPIMEWARNRCVRSCVGVSGTNVRHGGRGGGVEAGEGSMPPSSNKRALRTEGMASAGWTVGRRTSLVTGEVSALPEEIHERNHWRRESMS